MAKKQTTPYNAINKMSNSTLYIFLVSDVMYHKLNITATKQPIISMVKNMSGDIIRYLKARGVIPLLVPGECGVTFRDFLREFQPELSLVLQRVPV